MKARIYVTLRAGVLDPQGQAVGRTLARMGFAEVTDVRIGKYVEVTLAETSRARAEERVADMCRRLIANPVIEDYRIEILAEDNA
jgi:phosphoribosylformylglycinamidine synthase